MRLKNLAGQKFGRLTVIEYDHEKARWLCLCQCGIYKWILPPSLKRGTTQSCGCLQKERAAETQFKHGKEGSKVYDAWCHIKSRCFNPNDKQYKDYGGRGIKVCKRWLIFENFYKDMGDPSENGRKVSLDRKDNNGDYEPLNCRWADQKMQVNNQRRSKFYTYEGETHVLPDWAKIKGVSYYQLRQRIYQRGWSFEEAITAPPRYSPTLTNTNKDAKRIKRKPK
jgi:hypothetical protein